MAKFRVHESPAAIGFADLDSSSRSVIPTASPKQWRRRRTRSQPCWQLQELSKKIDEQNAKIDMLSQQILKLEQEIKNHRPGVMIGEGRHNSPSTDDKSVHRAPEACQSRQSATVTSSRRGETLTSIAKMHGVSVGELQKFNHIENPLKLHGGPDHSDSAFAGSLAIFIGRLTCNAAHQEVRDSAQIAISSSEIRLVLPAALSSTSPVGVSSKLCSHSRAYFPPRAISSSCVPRSMIRPRSSTRIWSARTIVESRCAITNRSAVRHQMFERFLDQTLRRRVHARRRFIQNQNRRILEQRARDREPLFFANAQLHSALADDAIQSFRQPLDERARVRRIGRAPQLRVASRSVFPSARFSRIVPLKRKLSCVTTPIILAQARAGRNSRIGFAVDQNFAAYRIRRSASANSPGSICLRRSCRRARSSRPDARET